MYLLQKVRDIASLLAQDFSPEHGDRNSFLGLSEAAGLGTFHFPLGA